MDLSKRELFAVQILQGLLSSPKFDYTVLNDYVSTSVQIADILIAELEGTDVDEQSKGILIDFPRLYLNPFDYLMDQVQKLVSESETDVGVVRITVSLHPSDFYDLASISEIRSVIDYNQKHGIPQSVMVTFQYCGIYFKSDCSIIKGSTNTTVVCCDGKVVDFGSKYIIYK